MKSTSSHSRSTNLNFYWQNEGDIDSVIIDVGQNICEQFKFFYLLASSFISNYYLKKINRLENSCLFCFFKNSMRRKIGYIKSQKRSSEITKNTAGTSHLDLKNKMKVAIMLNVPESARCWTGTDHFLRSEGSEERVI